MSEELTIFFTFAVFFCLGVSAVKAAEGGYRNYVPGTYGDFAGFVELPTKWAVNNESFGFTAPSIPGSTRPGGRVILSW